MQKPWLIFQQFCAFLTNCFAQSAHNFKVVFLKDRTTLWRDFMMNHAIAIKENSGQNLHIWPKLTCFFRSWLFWMLPLGLLGFGVNVVAIHSWFVTSYNLIICTTLFHIICTTLWQESMMHHAIAIAENIVSKTFAFDRLWRALFGLGSSVRFHWDD